MVDGIVLPGDMSRCRTMPVTIIRSFSRLTDTSRTPRILRSPLGNTSTTWAVIVPISLPDLDGWEATRRLKKDAKTQHIPVIALTAHAMSGDREKAIEAGCDEYDTKPIDLRRLLSKMIRFVEDPETSGGEKSMA